MTRKDYDLIAQAFASARRHVDAQHCDVDKAQIAFNAIFWAETYLANLLQKDNPRFNVETFAKACHA
jgi:hypothetical protein